ncbi:MAG: hypothetical protein JWP25_6188 [Bradyrhizobium sp.]|jgi:hypothetical protein|nr:hypothetical protein [Bradyrhizobium sp.]
MDVFSNGTTDLSGPTLTWLLGKRMLEEETQHFPRCVRPSRMSVGACRAASRPCVSSSVDAPVLKDSAPTRVGMDRAGKACPPGTRPRCIFFCVLVVLIDRLRI